MKPSRLIALCLVSLLFLTACGSSSSSASSAPTQSGPAATSGSLKGGNTQKSGGPVLQQDGFTITLAGVEYETGFNLSVALTVQNDTQYNARVSTRGFCVSGIMLDTYFSAEVPAGETATDTVNFYVDKMLQSGITQLKDIQVQFEIQDLDNYDTLFVSDIVSLDVRTPSLPEADFYTPPAFSPEELYSQNGITISYLGMAEEDGWATGIYFLVQNEYQMPIYVAIDDATLNDSVDELFGYAFLFSGSSAYLTVALPHRTLREEGIQSLDKLSFTFEIADGENNHILTTTEVFTLPLGGVPVPAET